MPPVRLSEIAHRNSITRVEVDGLNEHLPDQSGPETCSGSNSDTEQERPGIVRTLRVACSDTELDKMPVEGDNLKGRSATLESIDSFNKSRSNFIFFDRLTATFDSMSSGSPKD